MPNLRALSPYLATQSGCASRNTRVTSSAIPGLSACNRSPSAVLSAKEKSLISMPPGSGNTPFFEGGGRLAQQCEGVRLNVEVAEEHVRA